MVLGGKGSFQIMGCHTFSDGTLCYQRYLHQGAAYEENLMEQEKLIMQNLKKTLLALLEKTQTSLPEVALFIPQSINHFVYRVHAKNLKVPVRKFFLSNIPKGGHLGDVDSTRNFKDAVDTGRVAPGDRFVLFSLGELGDSFNFAGILIKYIE
jgi:3-oxoacyl-[acyl-carrier-protein] synthase-3